MATPRAHMSTVRRGRHRLFQSLEGTAILDILILDELATSMLCRCKELGESRQWAYCECHLSNPVVERWLWNNGQIPIGCSKTVLTLWWESTTEIWAKTWICLVFRNMFGKWLYIQWQASNRQQFMRRVTNLDWRSAWALISEQVCQLNEHKECDFHEVRAQWKKTRQWFQWSATARFLSRLTLSPYLLQLLCGCKRVEMDPIGGA